MAENAESYLRRGKAHYDDEDYDQAVPLLRRALAAKETRRDAARYLSEAHCRLGEPEEAVAVLTEAIRQQPEDPDLRTSLGAIYLQMGRVEPAVGAYQSAIERSPDKPFPYLGMAKACLKTGNVLEAKRYAERAREAAPFYGVVYVYLARIAEEEKRWYEAATLYIKASELGEDADKYLAHLGQVFLDLGDNQKARELLLRAIRSDETRLDDVFNLAVAENNLGNRDTAVRLWQGMTKASPGYLDAYRALLKTFWHQRDIMLYWGTWVRLVKNLPAILCYKHT